MSGTRDLTATGRAAPLRILHLCTQETGGAGTVALNLHRQFLRRGLDSRFLVLERRASTPDVLKLPRVAWRSQLEVFAGKVWSRLRADHSYYFPMGWAHPVSAVLRFFEQLAFKPDVLLCHWTSRFCTAAEIAELHRALGTPLVWYFHDMNPFTGGCHYPFDCRRYQDQCGCCPALRSERETDLSRRRLTGKLQALETVPLTGVAYGDYTARMARASALFRNRRVETIIPGVDRSLFAAGSREEARRALDLPADATVILAGSLKADERRKGGTVLVAALNELRRSAPLIQSNAVLALVGAAKGRSIFDEAGLPVIRLGRLSGERMVYAYRAADFYVCPSLQDAGPMMIAESVACGTPVVSFNTGIAAELIETGITGYVAEPSSPEALVSGIRYMLEAGPELKAAMRERCLERAAALLDPDQQAGRFLRLFEELCGGSAGQAALRP